MSKPKPYNRLTAIKILKRELEYQRNLPGEDPKRNGSLAGIQEMIDALEEGQRSEMALQRGLVKAAETLLQEGKTWRKGSHIGLYVLQTEMLKEIKGLEAFGGRKRELF